MKKSFTSDLAKQVALLPSEKLAELEKAISDQLSLQNAPNRIDSYEGYSIGEYKIVDKLGEGAMGVVYRAVQKVDAQSVRAVAIKLFRSQDQLAQRKEFANSIGFNHPNLVTLFQVGEIDGLMYHVMEFAESGSLQQHLKRQPQQSWELVADFLRQIATGLHELQLQKRLVHRDIKPANLFLGRLIEQSTEYPRGYRAIIGDFGHAILNDQLLAEQHLPFGTPPYYSPEMCDLLLDGTAGAVLGPEHDIFSLGIVGYEMLVGKNPFICDDPQQLKNNIQCMRVPSVLEARPEVPQLLASTIDGMLAKSPISRLKARNVIESMDLVLRGNHPAPSQMAAPSTSQQPIHIHIHSQYDTGSQSLSLANRTILPVLQEAVDQLAIVLGPDDERPSVLILGESPDIIAHRKILCDIVLQYQMKLEIIDDTTSDSQFLKAIKAAHLVIVLQGLQYKVAHFSLPGHPTNCSQAELGLRHAQLERKQTIVFLASDKLIWLRNLIQQDPELELRAAGFENYAQQNGSRPIFFDSPENLKGKAIDAFDKLAIRRATPDANRYASSDDSRSSEHRCRLPAPPMLYAVPAFAGQTSFVGRSNELLIIDHWLQSVDQVLVLQALGGSGKSMLAWNWCETRQTTLQKRFLGQIRYEFTKENTDFADFLRHSLGYIERINPESVQLDSTHAYRAWHRLIEHMNTGAYLLILDGVEWLMHDYSGQEASEAKQSVQGRCKHPEIGEFMKQLRVKRKSKVLLTSRLLPRELEDLSSRKALPLCQLYPLPDLSDADAMSLAAAAELKYTPEKLLPFVQSFGGHALTLGIVCGQVCDYPIQPRNFDAWLADSSLGGGSFRVSELSIVQLQEHILAKALEHLGHWELTVLRHVAASESPPSFPQLRDMLGEKLQESEEVVSPDRSFVVRLNESIVSLRSRELIRINQESEYGIHDLVRRHILDSLAPKIQRELNQKLLNYLEGLPTASQVTTLSDLSPEVDRVVYLVRLGRYREAYFLFDSLRTKLNSVHAYPVIIRLAEMVLTVIPSERSDNHLARNWLHLYRFDAMRKIGESEGVILSIKSILENIITTKNFSQLSWGLWDLVWSYRSTNRIAAWKVCAGICQTLVQFRKATYDELFCDLEKVELAILENRFEDARELSEELEPQSSGRNLVFFPIMLVNIAWRSDGDVDKVWQVRMNLAIEYRNLRLQAMLWFQRAYIRVDQDRFHESLDAIERSITIFESLHIRHARELDLKAYLLVRLVRPEEAKSCLTQGEGRYYAAKAYELLGEIGRARECAIAAYRWAWADGPSDCDMKALQDAKELLLQLNLQVPDTTQWLGRSTAELPLIHEITNAISDLASWWDSELIYLVRGNDTTNRAAWYYVCVEREKKSLFEVDAKKGQIQLTDYGIIITSGYGEFPPKDVRERMIWEYGFEE